MNRFITILCLSLVSLFCGMPIWAFSQDKVLTLNECIQLGLENKLEFKIEQLKVLRMEKAKRSTASRFLPQINAYGSHRYLFGSSIDPASNTRVSSNIQSDNLGIEGSLSLFNFNELWESKLSNDDFLIAQQNKAVIEREFILQVIQKYYDALAAQEWQKVIEGQLVNSKQQLERIQKEVEDGAKPESDEQDIQVVVIQEKKLLLQTQQEEANQKLSLMQLINNQDLLPDNITLVFNKAIAVPNTLEIQNHPAIQLEKLRLGKMEHEYTQLLGPVLPRVSLSYDYGTFYSNKIKDIFDTSLQFGSQLRNNKNQFLGLNLSIPIFSRGDRLQARRLKKMEFLEQEQLISKTTLDLNNKLQLERQKIKQFDELQPSLIEHMNFAEKSLERTQTKFEFGRVDISAYNAAKNQVLNASYDYLKNQLYKAMSINIMETMLDE